MNSNQFSSHSIFEKIKQFRDLLSGDEIRKLLDIEDINLFNSSLDFLEDKLKVTIYSLLQESEFDSISHDIDNCLINLGHYINDKNQAYLLNVRSHTYGFISKVRTFPFVNEKSYNYSKSVSTFEKTIKDKYSQINETAIKQEKLLSELNDEIRLNTQSVQGLFRQIEDNKSAIEDAIGLFEKRFENINSIANQQFDGDRNKFRSEFDALKDRISEEIDFVRKAIDADTTELRQKIEIKLTEAQKIVGTISDEAITGSYKLEANKNKRAADTFRIVAIGIMLCMSGLLICAVWGINESEFNWIKSLVRIFTSAALAYPAAYAARESAKHRKLEIQNRKAELELAAINPFIELLPDAKKQEIKAKLVEKYFGNNNSDMATSEGSDEININTFAKLLKLIDPLLKK